MVSPSRLSPALLLAGGLVLSAFPAFAADTGANLTGLWLTTDYPALTENIGQEATLSVELTNKNAPPERVNFDVHGLPAGWSWQLLGSGKPVTAAMAGPNQFRDMDLKITPAKDAKPGDYKFTLVGNTSTNQTLSLPLDVTLAAAKPEKLTLSSTLPALRGTPKSSFSYDIAIHNDSTRANTVNLISQTPPGFSASFTEQYGSQQLTSLPLKPGETKTVKVTVKPPEDVAAGKYPVTIGAQDPKVQGNTQVVLDITGQPGLSLDAADERLSGSAEAGKEKSFKFTVTNTGTAPAHGISVSADGPSGWTLTANPAKIDEIMPGAKQTVSVAMTPSNKAIAGDYMVNVRANGDGLSDSQQFRITVTTSTLWGAAGLGIIGAAVVVLAFAVTRYGRR
ncbi:NEW3 domain-containing protein [Allorhizobium sp. BGMRC 0089]|uniref:NEW3 domain-containing protein n=1 Tax=Allorhizobium sonneratiae TaxID=2934936 RepID=UPI002033B332|nr:NEW3 domain-containing protein [Allorhizobium sonneratiae]MCM2294251.1 NEW3 domain-containing protein [Allorhizobium sonneratiae]